MKLPAVIMATLALLAGASLAQDRADLERTQVIGNRELPKVLYIVPWKKPYHGLRQAHQQRARRSNDAGHRDVFRRHVNYDQQLHAPNADPIATPAAAR